jgi:hypothetical protein
MANCFLEISKIPLLDSPALFFGRQVAKFAKKKEKKKNTGRNSN